jgi:hypothetical protein
MSTAPPNGAGATRSRSDWVAALVSSTNVRWAVRVDNVRATGCEYYGEPMGVAEYVLAAPRRPEIFGRCATPEMVTSPRSPVEDLHLAARGEANVSAV